MKKAMKKIAAMIGIAPAALLMVLLAGNMPPMCGEIEPLEPVCDQAADCEGLPHIMCQGAWECDVGQCVWDCAPVPPTPVEPEVCMSSEECDVGRHCSTEDGVCNGDELCSGDGDGVYCLGVCLGTCVDDEEIDGCADDADCPAGQVCDIYDCKSPECPPGEPCPLYCEPVGQCVPGIPNQCDGDADCPNGYVCQVEEVCESTPMPCDGDEKMPCLQEQTCYFVSMCVPEPNQGCDGDADCPQGEYCVVACEIYCDEPEGDFCPAECWGYCVPDGPKECYNDYDCSKSEICVGGECVPYEDPMYCMSDEECPGGFYCDWDEDTYCYDQGADSDEDWAPGYCMGQCIPYPGCPEIPCPSGTEIDPETCKCMPVANTCIVSGCSGEICSDVPKASVCIWEPYYECFAPALTSCGPFGPGGTCMWEPTAAFSECMSNHFE